MDIFSAYKESWMIIFQNVKRCSSPLMRVVPTEKLALILILVPLYVTYLFIFWLFKRAMTGF